VTDAGKDVWTLQRILLWTQKFFSDKGISSPRLDAELLLAHVLGVERIYLYAHFDQPLTQSERDAYRALVKRRAAREPVAQILGKKEFYGRPFCVSREVLTPRPETEHLVDAALEWVRGRALEAPRLVDVGTGSGIIAVTLALELPSARVWGTDTSAPALAVARANAAALGVAERVTLCEGDLLSPLVEQAPFDAVVANLPYLDPAGRADLEPEVRDFEPASALFADEQGVATLRRLVTAVGPRLTAGGLLALEIGAEQRQRVEALLGETGFSGIETRRDLQGLDRVVLARR
jgi:release factor glutamine methyltransferase